MKDVRCLLGVHHWVKKHDPNPETPSSFYDVCSRCGKFHDIPYRPGVPPG